MMDDISRCRWGLRLALTLPFLLALHGCRKTVADDAGEPIVNVQATHPQFGPITGEILSDAVLTPVAQAAIQAKITAPVKTFYIQRGAKVRAGQLLATLENRDLAAAVLDNKGSYVAAQGSYTTATRQQVPQEETQARLDLDQARATLDLAESVATARAQLFAQGAIAGREVDTAKATALQAQAAYEIARQKFESTRKVGTQAALQTAEGQLASAKGKYLGAEAQLEYTSLRTPISGVVTDRPLFAGETAAAGAAVVTVMDTSMLLAKLHLSQSQAQQVVVGAEATITVPGLDEPVPAKVSLVSPALDPGSTTVEVWLRIDNTGGVLKAGSSVQAKIKARTIPQALTIPIGAVQRSGESGAKMVMVIAADGTVRKKNISVGIQTAEQAQVVDGLSTSDTVITVGGYGLDDGTKVKIQAAGAKPAAGDKE